MSTLVYAPAIRVHIHSEKNGIIDVSSDIGTWNLTRRSNNPSSFNFILQNAQRKYDTVFRPGDRVSVELKRITWVRVFTGSLNVTPIFSAWPRALPMSATCTLKKLQFWPWDPTTTAAANLTLPFFSQTGKPTTAGSGDGGLSKLITNALTDVTNWPLEQIHIGTIPTQWFAWAQKTEQLIDAAASMAAVLGPGSVSGRAIASNINFPTGNYGGVNISSAQAAIIGQIYAVIINQSGLLNPSDIDRAAQITFMVAMTESSMANLNHGDRDSVGVFQQRPSQGWGTSAQCQDVGYATLSFLKGPDRKHGLLSLADWRTAPSYVVAQEVQKSGFSDGSNYATFVNFGLQAAAKCRSIYQSQAATVTKQAAGQITDTIPTGVASGTQFAAKAQKLIQDHSAPGKYIRYDQSGVSGVNDPNPTVLDCSQLVNWVYYQTTGKNDGVRRSEEQYAQCQQAKTVISLEAAANIQGALLFRVDNGDAHHVGISMGNGEHVAAHDSYPDVSKDVTLAKIGPDEFNMGGLMPGIDYRNSATQEFARAIVAKLYGSGNLSTISLGANVALTGTDSTAPGTTVDPLSQLVTALAAPSPVSGDIFGGPRELINNQPFLPWLTNLVNSSMRSFCSAPNGDFMAWFPDYFNVWKTAATMKVELIELQDFTVDWSDQQIVTHEFVVGSIAGILDSVSGGITDAGSADYSGTSAMLFTNGIATMNYPQIFQMIYGKLPTNNSFVSDYLSRFGARPNLDSMPNIQGNGPQEFYMAVWKFMFYWASQFNATVPMTFMPELWPGMILQVPAYNFQAYVTEVTHSGTYGKGGSFTTQATIVAPASMDPANTANLFGILNY